jgi:hypothetical protein
MKHVIQLLIPSIVAVIFLTACGHNKSLTQRHYNNRYYIGMSQRERTDEVSVGNDEPGIENTVPAEKASEYLPVENTTVDFSSSDSRNPGPMNDKADETYSGDETAPLNFRAEPGRKLNEYPHAWLKKATEVKEKAALADTADDALSLLWIVIVVILILWLLGFAFGGFGIGGAIHILAVIALILLILWLLRII